MVGLPRPLLPPLTPGAIARIAVYLVAAVVGAVLTARFNSQFVEERGTFDVAQYVRDGFVNGASSSFTTDILVVAVVALLFMAAEGWRLRMWLTIPLMLSTFVLALAFSFPAWLALRELRVARVRAADPASERTSTATVAASPDRRPAGSSVDR